MPYAMKQLSSALWIKLVFCATSSGLNSTFQLHLHLKWAELRGGGYADTARENKRMEISLQIATSLKFSIYLAPRLFLSFTSSEG